MDQFSPEKRSDIMRRVRGHSTTPEMRVRRVVHSLGYRYVLHPADLPGRPDLVFRRLRRVVFVHGCFWHRHAACSRGSKFPASNHAYWKAKLEANSVRDVRTCELLQRMAWDVLVIWECEARDAAALEARLVDFLGSPRFDPHAPARS